jgi:hypothetical protein
MIGSVMKGLLRNVAIGITCFAAGTAYCESAGVNTATGITSCAWSAENAKKDAHDYFDLLSTGQANFITFFDGDYADIKSPKHCALQPFLKELSRYELEKIGRTDVVYDLPTAPPLQIGSYNGGYVASDGSIKGYKIDVTTIVVGKSFAMLGSGSTEEQVTTWVKGNLKPESAPLFVELFNKHTEFSNKQRVATPYKASLFGATNVLIKKTN